MEVGTYTNMKQGLVDVYSAAYLRSGYSTMKTGMSHVSGFGDSVKISPEAMSLFTKSYTTLNDTNKVATDGFTNSASVAKKATDTSAQDSSAGGQNNQPGQSSSISTQIESLQVQLAGLMSQIQNNSETSSDLQGQIAQLQAQLQSLQAQL